MQEQQADDRQSTEIPGWDPLPEPLRLPYRHLLRLREAIASRSVPVESIVLRRFLEDQAMTGHGLTYDEASKIAIRVLNAPERGTGADRFLAARETVAALLEREITRPPAVIGEGLIVGGTVSLLCGRAGVGKSWILLQFAVAVARGAPCLTLATMPAKVGLLLLELTDWYWRDRFLHLTSEDRSGLDRIEVVCRPALRGAVDLLDLETTTALSAWTRDAGLGLLVIDPLVRAHTGQENTAEDMARVMAAAEEIAVSSGAAVLINHHEGKARVEAKLKPGRAEHLDAARGSSVLQSHPTTILRLLEARGLHKLVAAKANLGPEPAPIYLARTITGAFAVSEAPVSAQERGRAAREAIMQALANNEDGLTSSQLAEILAGPQDKPMRRTTINRHLSALDQDGQVHHEGPRQNYVWFAGPGNELGLGDGLGDQDRA